MKDIKGVDGGSGWLDSLDQKLGLAAGKPVEATLRQAAVKRAGGGEQILTFCCARTGAPFSVTVARASSSEKFRITSIDVIRPGGSGGSAAGAPAAGYTASEIDFSGWKCAHCGHFDTPGFVQCHKCRRLVCGGTVIQIRNGPRTFKCEPGCGGGGALSGEIETYETIGKTEARTAAKATVASPNAALPSPNRVLLPRSK
jgi:hypothetical protein